MSGVSLSAQTPRSAAARRCRAFTIAEATVAMAMLVLLVTAICGGIQFAFSTVNMSRQNTRATQILLEKMEQIRLFNWDQLTNPTNSYVPTNEWLVHYYSTNLGVIYTGRVSVAAVSLPGVAYTNDMRQVTVSLRWKTGEIQRSRSLSTFVSRYGVQNYIY